MQVVGTTGEVFYIRGVLKTDQYVPPADSVGNSHFNAGDPLTTDKQWHQYRPIYEQKHGTAAATERRVIHVANAAGTVDFFEAGVLAAIAGAATVDFDLLKNGVSILDAAVELNSGSGTGGAAYDTDSATIDTADYVTGDVFEVAVTATAGGGTLPNGIFAVATFREEAGA